MNINILYEIYCIKLIITKKHSGFRWYFKYHLDIHTTEWLETFLKEFKGAQLIVSHDRYFLDQVCNRIVEVDNLRAWPWKGNYTQFLAQKTASEAALADAIGNLEKKIQSTMGAMAQMKRANVLISVKE